MHPSLVKAFVCSFLAITTGAVSVSAQPYAFELVKGLQPDGDGYSIQSATMGNVYREEYRPDPVIVQGTNGYFYGTAYGVFEGFYHGMFEVKLEPVASGNSEDNMVRQTMVPGGREALTRGQDNQLYGVAEMGGANEVGFVFRALTPFVNEQNYEIIYNFDGVEAQRPVSVTAGADGALYGITAPWEPAVFKVTTNGAFTKLRQFTNDQVLTPLLFASDGNLYGCTTHEEHGTIFKITPGGAYTLLHTFGGVATGRSPSYGALVEGDDGFLYGILEDGSTNGFGAVYRIAKDGSSYSVVCALSTGLRNIVGGLTKGDSGKFLLVSDGGGTNDNGAIAEVSTNGTISIVHSAPPHYTYHCETVGDNETRCRIQREFVSGLTRGTDGAFYGCVRMIDGETYSSGLYRLFTPYAPAISVQPDYWDHPAQSAGSTERLRVLARGGNLSYQWRQNGVPLVNGGTIAGADSAELWVSNLTASASGIYDVVITNSMGAVTSAIVQVTITNDPAITLQPASKSVGYGAATTFTVQAAGEAPLFYQWRKNNVNLTDAGNVAGSTTATLSITSVSGADAGSYSVIVSNSVGSVESSPAVLTVVNDPHIVTQPSNATVVFGASTNFTVVANGPGLLHYQWRKDGANLVDGENVAGATTATLTLSNVSSSDGGPYSVVVSNEFATVTSTTAQLIVTDAPVVIVSQPVSRTNVTGTTATFTVGATYDGPLYYSWVKGTIYPNGSLQAMGLADGAKYSGAHTATLTIKDVSFNDATNYFVFVTTSPLTSALGPSIPRSEQATLTVVNPTTITSHPIGRTVFPGTNVSFTVSATGDELTYQWKKNGSDMNDGENVSGSTSATLNISNVQEADLGSYSVIVVGLGASITSNPALLQFHQPPTIALQPQSRTNVAGTTASFAVSATGINLSYQWQKNGIDVEDTDNVSGATTATLTLGTVVESDAGSYSVIVNNGSGSVTSSDALLTVLSDVDKPVVSITYPKAVAYSTNVLSVMGTAKDPARVSQVLYSFNDGPFSPAALTYVGPGKPTNWSVTVHSKTGTNTVVVKAIDPSGNESVPAKVTYFYHVPSTFTYNIGLAPGANGTVEPVVSMAGTPVNGASLFVGRGYKIRAYVGAGTNSILTNITYTAANGESGQLFTNMAALPSVTLDFVMKTNLHLDFNFIQNPILNSFGSYYGLVADKTNGVSHASAGFIQIALSKNYNYSAKVLIHGNSVPFSGKLPLDGKVLNAVISRALVERSNLVCNLNVDFTGLQKVTGTISDPSAGWTSELEADRYTWNAITNPATAWTNKYTAVVPGFTNKADGPPGFGTGLLTVGTTGKSVWSGTLGDFETRGTRFTSSSFISGQGYWPFYQALYPARRTLQRINPITLQPVNIVETRGLMIGWLGLTTNHLGNLRPEGEVSWIRTTWTNLLYTGGFTNLDVPIAASRWLTPTQAGQYPLNAGTTNWTVTLTDGNLPAPYTINAYLYTNKVVAVPGQPKFPTVSLVKTSGAMSGKFVHPTTLKSTPFTAVALQDLNYGAGWFMGPAEGGVMTFTPNP